MQTKFVQCNTCKNKYKDKLMRPYSLEYSAMQVVLNKYIKNEMLNGLNNYFKGMNLSKKWKEYMFAFHCSKREIKKRNKSIPKERRSRTASIIKSDSINIIKYLLEDPMYIITHALIDEKKNLSKFCSHCHTTTCSKCYTIRKASNWRKRLRSRGHLSQCPYIY